MIGVVPHADLAMIQQTNPDAILIDLNEDYQRFRLVKSPAEMVFVNIASRMNDAAIDALADAAPPRCQRIRGGANRRGRLPGTTGVGISSTSP